jgi:hypothetical protein
LPEVNHAGNQERCRHSHQFKAGPGEYVPYTRTAEQKRAVQSVKQSAKRSDSLPSGWASWAGIFVERRALGLPVFEGDTVCDKLIQGCSPEFLEHQLDIAEEKWAAELGLSSIEELRQYLRWWAQHQGEPLPPDCAEAKQAKLVQRTIELSHCPHVAPDSGYSICSRCTHDNFIEHLKITNITLNAGGPLTDAELQDVVLARAKLAAEKATWRTAEQMAIERFRKESALI